LKGLQFPEPLPEQVAVAYATHPYLV
jgi:hypothetical protein